MLATAPSRPSQPGAPRAAPRGARRLLAPCRSPRCQTRRHRRRRRPTPTTTARHPIALVNAPTDLDLFVGRNAAGLDPRQAQDLQPVLRQDYRADGRGPMLMLVPASDRQARRQPPRRARPCAARWRASGVAARIMRPDHLLRGARRRARLAGPADLRQAAGEGDVASAATGSQDVGGAGAHARGLAEQALPQLRLRLSDRDRHAGRRSARPRRAPRAEGRSDVMRRMKVVRRRPQGRRSLDATGRPRRPRPSAGSSRRKLTHADLLDHRPGRSESTPPCTSRPVPRIVDPGLLRDARRRRA